jgi:O-antigen/teichoic acid export membrane protein
MRKHGTNSAWVVAETVGYTVLVLALTPILLKQLGQEGFGLWTLLITIISLGAIVNTGTNAAITRLTAHALARNDERELESVAGGALAIVGYGGGLLALAIAFFFVVASDAALKMMGPYALVATTGCVGAFAAWIDQFDAVFHSLLKGAERFGIAARVELATKLAQLTACALIAIVGGGLIGVYGAYVAMALLKLAVKAVLTLRTWPQLQIRPNARGARVVLSLSKWGWLQGLGAMSFNVADRLLVGSILGSASLTYYAISTQLTSQIHTVASAAFSIIAPAVSRNIGKNRSGSTLWPLIRKAIAINVLSSAGLAAFMYAAGPTILRHWVGPDVASHSVQILGPLVVAYFVLSASIVPFYVLNGLGNMKTVSLICISGGLVGLAAGVGLTMSLGLNGIALSRSVYAIAAMLLFIPMHRELSRST